MAAGRGPLRSGDFDDVAVAIVEDPWNQGRLELHASRNLAERLGATQPVPGSSSRPMQRWWWPKSPASKEAAAKAAVELEKCGFKRFSSSTGLSGFHCVVHVFLRRPPQAVPSRASVATATGGGGGRPGLVVLRLEGGWITGVEALPRLKEEVERRVDWLCNATTQAVAMLKLEMQQAYGGRAVPDKSLLQEVASTLLSAGWHQVESSSRQLVFSPSQRPDLNSRPVEQRIAPGREVIELRQCLSSLESCRQDVQKYRDEVADLRMELFTQHEMGFAAVRREISELRKHIEALEGHMHDQHAAEQHDRKAWRAKQSRSLLEEMQITLRTELHAAITEQSSSLREKINITFQDELDSAIMVARRADTDLEAIWLEGDGVCKRVYASECRKIDQQEMREWRSDQCTPMRDEMKVRFGEERKAAMMVPGDVLRTEMSPASLVANVQSVPESFHRDMGHTSSVAKDDDQPVHASMPLAISMTEPSVDASGQITRQIQLDCQNLKAEGVAVESLPNSVRVFALTSDGGNQQEIYAHMFDPADGLFDLREDECFYENGLLSIVFKQVFPKQMKLGTCSDSRLECLNKHVAINRLGSHGLGPEQYSLSQPKSDSSESASTSSWFKTELPSLDWPVVQLDESSL